MRQSPIPLPDPTKAFLFISGVTTFSAWIAFFSFFFIPSDAKSSWLLGFSQLRWVSIAIAFSVAAAATIFFIYTHTHRNFLEHIVNRLKNLTNSKLCLVLYYLFIFIAFALFSTFFANWHFYQHDEYLNAYFLRTAPFVFWLGIAIIVSVILVSLLYPHLLIDYVIFFIFLGIIILIDSFTNNLEIAYMPWDIKYYYLLAEKGLSGERIAPYVYRYATPFLARQIADIIHLTTYQGYTVIAYIGALSQLFILYLFLKDLGASVRSAFLACLMIALSHFNVKYLLFDVSRPEHLAYFWVTITSWAALQSQWIWCGIFTLIGMQFREHIAIPSFIVIYEQIKTWWNARRITGNLMQISFLVICLLAAIVIPRIFIQTTDSTQFVDPQHPATLFNLIYLPLDLKRDINFFYVIVAYLLPILLLYTPQRIKKAWDQLTPYHPFLLMYSAIVIILTLYGGHDLMRYITFLFLPQALLLSRLFEQSIPKSEIIAIVVLMLIFNRIFWYIPIENFDQNADFYGGYDNRINIFSLIRWLEIFLSIGILVVIRSLQYNHKSALRS